MGAQALALIVKDRGSDDPRLADDGLRRLIGTDARLAFWQAATAGHAAPDPTLERRLARDILSAMGQVSVERLLARRGPMLARAASGLRAAADSGDAVGSVEIAELRHPYAEFFAVEEFDLRFRRFDGTMSPLCTRAVFVACDAVSVLPYDPLRDRVLLIEQMRMAPLARGATDPWMLEAVAGRVDAGETPEEAARREAMEEAGLALRHLEMAVEYYPTAGALSEYLYAYVGLTDLPDGCAGIHGLEGEAEDIRGHLLDWSEVMARLAAGQISCGPLLVLVMWLARERDRLRRGN